MERMVEVTTVGTNQSRFLALLVVAGGIAWQVSELYGDTQFGGGRKDWIERAQMTMVGAGSFWVLFMGIVMSDVGVR